jgi:hypothetical protein
MEIRLSGTREECTDLAAVLPDLLGHVAQFQRVSRFYPDHPDRARSDTADSGRVYVHLAPMADTAPCGPPPGQQKRRPGLRHYLSTTTASYRKELPR